MIYANYAAGTPALSEKVANEICDHLRRSSLNSGRNFEGLDEAKIALRARRAIAALLHADDPLRVIFTSGATLSLNMAIRGLVRRGDRVLATGVEHNAAARPLFALAKSGKINLEWLECERDGSLKAETLKRAMRTGARMLVMSHASNALGTILPAAECFEIAREGGALTILDMAQSAGVLPWSAEESALCDVAVFAGHKGLGALSGIGGFVASQRALAQMRPWVLGGTGSASDSLEMPEFLPDRFEAGTQNTLGVLSLAASVEEILATGVDAIRERERALFAGFLDGLSSLKKIAALGTRDAGRSVAVVSLLAEGLSPGELSLRLFERRGIVSRSGLHCAPLAHKTAGTFPAGATRLSFGRSTTKAEIDAILETLSEL